jgi:hypothetical protein
MENSATEPVNAQAPGIAILKLTHSGASGSCKSAKTREETRGEETSG